MKKKYLAVIVIGALAIPGCKTPIVKPVDTFVNKTAGPELMYYWNQDLKTEKKFVKSNEDLKARMMNLRTMQMLIEEAKKNDGYK